MSLHTASTNSRISLLYHAPTTVSSSAKTSIATAAPLPLRRGSASSPTSGVPSASTSTSSASTPPCCCSSRPSGVRTMPGSFVVNPLKTEPLFFSPLFAAGAAPP